MQKSQSDQTFYTNNIVYLRSFNESLKDVLRKTIFDLEFGPYGQLVSDPVSFFVRPGLFSFNSSTYNFISISCGFNLTDSKFTGEVQWTITYCDKKGMPLGIPAKIVKLDLIAYFTDTVRLIKNIITAHPYNRLINLVLHICADKNFIPAYTDASDIVYLVAIGKNYFTCLRIIDSVICLEHCDDNFIVTVVEPCLINLDEFVDFVEPGQEIMNYVSANPKK